MFTVNIPKLTGKIYERGYNKTSFSKACGFDRGTLDSYLKNPEKIPYSVVDKMASILCDSSKEAEEIFFALELS